MSVIGEALIRIRPDSTGFEGEAKLSVGRALAGVAGLASGLIAAAGVGKFFSGAIAEATEAQKVFAQTAAVLKSTGDASGLSKDQIAALANQLSGLVGVDNEVIQQGENVLLTFTSIRDQVGAGNDIFTQATKITLDMSKALGTDLQSSVIQVGKALQDPILGLTALRRVGVNFTQQQQDQIKALVESNHQLDAQKLILAELNKEFGGVAAATATPLEKLKVAFKDLEQTVGEALGPTLAKLAPIFADVIKGLEPVLGALGSALGTALSALGPIVQTLAPPLAQLLGVFGQLLIPVGALLAALAPVTAIFIKLTGSVLTALLPIITLVAGAFAKMAGTIIAALGPVLVQIQPLLGRLAEAFLQIVTALLPLLPIFAQLVIAALPMVPALTEIVTLIAEFIAAIPPGVLEAIVGAFILLNSEIVAVVAVAAGLVLAAQFIVDHWQGIADFFTGLWDRIKTVFSTAIDIILSLIGNWPRTILAILTGGLSEVVAFIVRHWDTIKETAGNAIQAVIGFFTALPGRIAGAITSLISTVTALPGKILGAIGDLGPKLFRLGIDAFESMARGIESIVPRLLRIAGDLVARLVKKLDPRNWFSTPEEHYRELWGAAFDAIGDEAKKATPAINAAVAGVTAAGSPAPGSRPSGAGSAASNGAGVHIEQLNVHEVANDPEATAFATATQLGLAASRR